MAKPESQAGGAVSEETREADRRDGKKQGKPDRMPTPAEERAAEKFARPDGDVAANYKSDRARCDVKARVNRLSFRIWWPRRSYAVRRVRGTESDARRSRSLSHGENGRTHLARGCRE